MQRGSVSTDRSSQGNRQLLPRGERRWTRMVFVLSMLALVSTVGRAGEVAAEQFPTDAIGRLIVEDNRLCTAFIVRSVERHVVERFGGSSSVYENWLATAGHCFGSKLVFQQGTSVNPVMRIIGFSAGDTVGHDVMVLGFVTHTRMPTLEPAFGVYPQVGDPLMLIGYGAKALMMRVGPLIRYDERGHMEIHGYASRGNSGGPVLIPGTRRVVGIGIETTLDKPEGASYFYCMLAGCAVKPPYVATHIDRLRGIASFR